jgi:hypothetical protein
MGTTVAKKPVKKVTAKSPPSSSSSTVNFNAIATATKYLPAGASTVSTTNWAKAELVLIGAPITTNNVTNMQLWLANEQDASSWEADATNPFGVETDGKVQANPSALDGAIQMANTLQGNSSYAPILHALRTNAPTQIFASAVVYSPWNTGKTDGSGYGGAAKFLAHTPLNTTATGVTHNSAISDLTDTANTAGSALGITGLGTVVGDIASSSFWKRVGVFFFGVVLVGGGVVLFVVTSKDGKKAESLAPVAAAAG